MAAPPPEALAPALTSLQNQPWPAQDRASPFQGVPLKGKIEIPPPPSPLLKEKTMDTSINMFAKKCMDVDAF